MVITRQAPNTATPDSYVRLTLFNQTRAVKTKRTGIIRRNAEPCYNESFHFRLEAATIDATNIVLAIHQPDNKGTSNKPFLGVNIHSSVFRSFLDRILGRLVLGSFMFARGRGLAHWWAINSVLLFLIQEINSSLCILHGMGIQERNVRSSQGAHSTLASTTRSYQLRERTRPKTASQMCVGIFSLWCVPYFFTLYFIRWCTHRNRISITFTVLAKKKRDIHSQESAYHY